ncbi:hypothetical protein Bca52824_046925 [Brassica carinata]|uniref:Cysteine proteinase inhibitor n=1 Tax=Brassica carinata TaxID=52824 RepID=A0A8X7RFD8_BRACI|nr:hypothetical protein Bca52824_046925 [Brassica carinata]
MHQLTPEINGVDKKTLCEAKVWVNSRLNFKELQEFKHVGDDASITTTPILAANNVVHANAEVWIHEQINDFELLEYVLLLAVKLPLAWPSFRAHGKELTEVLSNIQDWKLEGVTRESNVHAFKLASSVTQEHRFQSYGSRGDPVWLRRILEEEQKRCYLPGNC